MPYRNTEQKAEKNTTTTIHQIKVLNIPSFEQ